MRKLDIRLVAVAGLLWTSACFTPESYAEALKHGHGEDHGGEHAEGASHEESAEAEHAEGEHADGEASEPVLEGIVEGSAPQVIEAPEIEYEPPFDGQPIQTAKITEDEILVEDFDLGSGEAIVSGKLVSFNMKLYDVLSGRLIQESGIEPVKLVVDTQANSGNALLWAASQAMVGMKVGGKRRITVPSAVFQRAAAAGGPPPPGDIVLIADVVSVTDAPVLQGAEAYSGEPVATQTLDSGLVMTDFKAGEGREAKPGDRVVVHYIGKLEDDTTFDSSHGKGDGMPVLLGRGGVIRGFDQGLAGARKGMLRKLVIPPELGYGPRGQGKIPPNATLTFLLEVMEVTDGPPMPSRPPARAPQGARPQGGPPPGGPPPGGSPAGR